MSVGVLAPDLSEGYFTRVMSGVVEELTGRIISTSRPATTGSGS